MWVPAEELGSILKHWWWSSPFTESNVHYGWYDNRTDVDMYTLRFNLTVPNFSEEVMIDVMIQKVMKRFSTAQSLIGQIDYDRLLVSQNANTNEPVSYYLFRANSNQRASSKIIEKTLSLDQHQLYLFGKKALEVDLSELSDEFIQKSGAVVHSILAVVYTFSVA